MAEHHDGKWIRSDDEDVNFHSGNNDQGNQANNSSYGDWFLNAPWTSGGWNFWGHNMLEESKERMWINVNNQHSSCWDPMPYIYKPPTEPPIEPPTIDVPKFFSLHLLDESKNIGINGITIKISGEPTLKMVWETE